MISEPTQDQLRDLAALVNARLERDHWGPGRLGATRELRFYVGGPDHATTQIRLSSGPFTWSWGVQDKSPETVWQRGEGFVARTLDVKEAFERVLALEHEYVRRARA